MAMVSRRRVFSRSIRLLILGLIVLLPHAVRASESGQAGGVEKEDPFVRIQESKDLREELYEFVDACQVSTKKDAVRIELHKAKDEAWLRFHRPPPYLFILQSADKELVLPGAQRRSLGKHVAKVQEGMPRVLCLDNNGGGNGWNCSSWHVISLEEKSYLKYLGEVSDLWDVDKDGDLDFWDNVDVFESTPWLCHAGSPLVRVFYRVTDKGLDLRPA